MGGLRILSCVLLGTIALMCLYRISLHLYRHYYKGLRARFFLHIVHPRLFSRPFLLNPTRADTILYLVHWTATGICNAYNVGTLAEAGLRAGKIALIHLVPLFAAPHLSLSSDLLGWTLASSYRLHRALGLMAAAQGIFHCAISIHAIPIPTVVGAACLTVYEFRLYHC